MLHDAKDTPWKIRNELERLLLYPYIRINFALNAIQWGRYWKIYGMPLLLKHRKSSIVVGDRLQLRSTLRSNPLGPYHRVIICTWNSEAHLKIGVNFAMTGGSICAAKSIEIGNNVTVGANTIICDTDFHPIKAEDRKIPYSGGDSRKIRIEDDVFIGMSCIILKGVVIGSGAVIGAGSVVSKDVPALTIAAGNPAKAVKKIGASLF